MIITGGKFKGQKITTVKNNLVRPTSSKVRQSIFNVLQNHLEDAVVLDLFAGSGIFGIEAYSRGASEIFFVEKCSDVSRYIKQNISKFDLKYSFFQTDALAFLKKQPEYSFDLIFLDPPYNSKLIEESIEIIINKNILRKGGIIVAEQKSDKDLSQIVNKFNLNLLKQKKYGDTIISFIQQL